MSSPRLMYKPPPGLSAANVFAVDLPDEPFRSPVSNTQASQILHDPAAILAPDYGMAAGASRVFEPQAVLGETPEGRRILKR